MKTMKVALLATAGLAAATLSARADDVADLKAQLEALNARVAQLEASPSLPTGYSLISFSEGEATAIPGLVDRREDLANYGTKTNVISILPTADAPATAEIVWTGFVRAAIEYVDYGGTAVGISGDDDLNIRSRAELKVAAKTDTAVGEVGVTVKLRADAIGRDSGDVASRDFNPTVTSPEYWGYWAMTPEWTLGGGYTGSLANVPYGYDGFCACYYVDDSLAFDLNPNDAQQLRLSYVSGPLSFAVAVEDGTNVGDTDDSLGVTARLKYDGDAFSAGIMGGYWDDDDFVPPAGFNETEWVIGAGASFSLGDMATLSIGVQGGELFSGQDFWGISSGLSADLTETVNVQLGLAYKDIDFDDHVWAVAGGVYWNPVDQLTIGLEAEYSELDIGGGADGDAAQVDLVTVYRFQ